MKNSKTLKALSEQSEFMLYCEAKFWNAFIRNKGYGAWMEHKRRMVKRRGNAGVEKLTDKMKELGASAV